jgi:hypothetical protein
MSPLHGQQLSTKFVSTSHNDTLISTVRIDQNKEIGKNERKQKLENNEKRNTEIE